MAGFCLPAHPIDERADQGGWATDDKRERAAQGQTEIDRSKGVGESNLAVQ